MKFIKKSFLLALVFVLFPFFSLSGEGEPLTSTFKPQPHNNSSNSIRKLASAENPKVSLAVVFDPETKKAKCVQEVANSPHFVPRHMEVAKTQTTNMILDLFPRCDKTTQAWLAQNSPKMIKRDPEEVAMAGVVGAVSKPGAVKGWTNLGLATGGCYGSYHFGQALAETNFEEEEQSEETARKGVGGLSTGAGATLIFGLINDFDHYVAHKMDHITKGIIENRIMRSLVGVPGHPNKVESSLEDRIAVSKHVEKYLKDPNKGIELLEKKILGNEYSVFFTNLREARYIRGLESLRAELKELKKLQDIFPNKASRKLHFMKKMGGFMGLCAAVGWGVAYFSN